MNEEQQDIDLDEEHEASSDPVAALKDEWPLLDEEMRVRRFQFLPRSEAEDFFLALGTREQSLLILALPDTEKRSWLRQLAPDDAADVVQEVDGETRYHLIGLLDRVTRREVTALLAYAEDEAGGLMSPRYARLRPDMSVDEAIAYLRRQARRPIETISYAYVTDQDQTLLGVVSFRGLLLESGSKLVSEIMERNVLTVQEHTDQEEVSRLFSKNNLIAVPVVDSGGKLKGIVTIDDMIEALEEEVTEDIQKIGGSEALDAPYLEVSFWQMVKKRAGWLSVLFVGEMFTANAMSYYENEIERAVVLAMFIPLVISSGGNSGSQASTLVVRAIALGEVRSRHWFRVLRREIASGLILGLILGTLGFLRVYAGPQSGQLFGEHAMLIGLTVFFSLIGIVLWGTIAGSMLPLLLRRLGLDPASASAPFVATIVDVTGLIIYFTTASILLSGTLL